MKMHHSEITRSFPDDVLPCGILQWLLFIFIIGAMTLSYVEVFAKIMVLYGTVFAFLFIIYFLYCRLKLQPEILVYFGWVIWSLGGALNAIDRTLYMEEFRGIFHVAVLILIVAGITARYQTMSLTMSAIFVSGVILIGQMLYTGELQRSSDYGAHYGAAGITGNANEFAYVNLFVMFAIVYLWKIKPSLRWRVVLLIVSIMSFICIIYSGSRKGFLGLLAFIFLWWVFCQGKRLAKHPIKAYIVLLILLGGIYYFADYVISSTYLGNRLEQIEDTGNQKRVQMYKEGFNIIKNNPIFGIGLDNYRVLSSFDTYSHSDYIEVAASTGIVGFLLYFSIYIILWRRLNRIKAITKDPHLLYIIGLLKAAIITILLVAFGRPNIISKLTWIFVACAIGYSWALERTLSISMLQHKKYFGKNRTI